ncbi:MAG: class II fructose-bisphosphatase [Deltaproteobacteria bacterium]|nr:class II fructose-bisphosphatase [Deltaproteobacteria bacterium]
MDRNFALEFIRVTESAALASARLMGRGDGRAADQAAVDAMRRTLASVACHAVIAVGEGERDEAPMLYQGEIVGSGNGIRLSLAVDPLEGTNLCATGGPGALSVIAAAEEGNFPDMPDTYMDKIAVGAEAKGAIDIDASVEKNLRAVAEAKRKRIEDLTVVMLDRPRHEKLLAEVRRIGARIKLIGDGDISAAVATSLPDTGVDLLLGIGGAPEGVIAAAALRATGGDFQARLKPRSDDEVKRLRKLGFEKIDRKLSLEDIAKGEVMFAATGVTDGDLLKGVRFISGGALTNSIVMRSKSRTIRVIEATHRFEFKPVY